MSLRKALIVAAVAALIGTSPQILRAEESPPAEESQPAATRPTEATAPENAEEIPDYWIGVACSPLSDALRAQLSLEDKGLLVEEVAPKSPAQKAGIERHDVLISADAHPLRTVEDLVKHIARYDGTKAISVELVRHARRMTVQVTPEKRPPEYFKPHEIVRREPDFSAEAPLLVPGAPAFPPLRVPIPGVPQAGGKPAGNMRISITKSNNQPAKIEVVHNGKTYNVTENTLDQLPADVRKSVEDMLNGMKQRRLAPPIAAPGNFPFPPLPSMPPTDDQTLDTLKQQLEAMRERLEQIEKQRKKAAEDRASPAEDR
ncbi:hypothetical protein JCM19992_11250 [Thermostilla marina]